MREIKFMAWHKEKKILREVLEISFSGGYVILAGFGSFGEIEAPIRDVELMQYTGLKDQNGKKIYEGYIVRFYPQAPRSEELPNPRYGEMGEIFFDIGSFAVRPIDKKREVLEFFLNELGDWVVVGNIYENKELLND
ncbi:YopX family protein [Campylobacter concisus]|uniref:YopX family protein n=1 Tax=Campylobacter concisus TaxID=199 RepID=UPI000D2F8507|nr:YopX family protein [Campylobacter concisus]